MCVFLVVSATSVGIKCFSDKRGKKFLLEKWKKAKKKKISSTGALVFHSFAESWWNLFIFLLFFLFMFCFCLYLRRVVSMGGCSLALSMVLYLTETLYFRSSELTFYVTFPCVLNCKLNKPANIQYFYVSFWTMKITNSSCSKCWCNV